MYLLILYWLVVWNIFYFPIYWEFHHPNWLIFFRGVETTNQITNCNILGMIGPSILGKSLLTAKGSRRETSVGGHLWGLLLWPRGHDHRLPCPFGDSCCTAWSTRCAWATRSQRREVLVRNSPFFCGVDSAFNHCLSPCHCILLEDLPNAIRSTYHYISSGWEGAG